MIDHVCNTTGKGRIQYIGYSMGVTAFVGALNEHPSMAGKIKIAHFLAPVVYLSGLKAKYGHLIRLLTILAGGQVSQIKKTGQNVCDYIESFRVCGAMAST